MYESAVEAAALLSVVADPSRIAILTILARGPACVCTLLEHIPVAANVLSYHLKVLRDADVIQGVRRGRWIEYALRDEALEQFRRSIPTPEQGVTGTATRSKVKTTGPTPYPHPRVRRNTTSRQRHGRRPSTP